MATFAGKVVLNPVAVKELLQGANGPVARRLMEDGELVKNEARRLVGVHTPDPWGRPKNRKPGQLRDSIVKRFVPGGPGGFSVEVGSEDPIALWHHEGTVPHIIQGRRWKPPGWSVAALIFFPQGSNRPVVARMVHHPGTKPNRYLTNALAVLRGRY